MTGLTGRAIGSPGLLVASGLGFLALKKMFQMRE